MQTPGRETEDRRQKDSQQCVLEARDASLRVNSVTTNKPRRIHTAFTSALYLGYRLCGGGHCKAFDTRTMSRDGEISVIWSSARPKKNGISRHRTACYFWTCIDGGVYLSYIHRSPRMQHLSLLTETYALLLDDHLLLHYSTATIQDIAV